MTDAAPAKVALTLSIAPKLEDRVVDWLLARADVATFTSVVVYGYGADAGRLSIADQVSGRHRRVELTVEMPASAVDMLLENLAAAFVAAEVGYRVTPVLRAGQLGVSAT